MSHTTIRRPQGLLEYIDSLELAVPSLVSMPDQPQIARTRLASDSGSAAVVAGALFGFTPEVTGTHQSDVKNSMLLAQLAANKKHDRERETEQWYRFYTDVLENVGWVLTGFGFSRYDSSGSSFTMDRAVLDILTAVASGNELVIFQSALDALSKLPGNDKAVTLFDSNGSSSEAGNFQAGTVSEDPSGNVQMSIGASYFKASEHHTQFLFWSWSTKSINMYNSGQSIILNEDIYKQGRQAIIKKLGDKAKEFIADIDI